MTGHKGSITTAALSHKGQSLITGSVDCTMRLWSLQTHQCLRIYQGHRLWVTAVSFSSNGSHIVSAGLDKQVCLYIV